MPTDLESRIISALSGESPVLYRISDELRKLLREARESEPALEDRFAPILLCLEFHDNETVDKGMKGYGPLSELPDGKGMVKVYPHPDTFTDEMIATAKAEIDLVTNPFVKARVYDVLWCLRSAFAMAQKALASYDQALSLPKDIETVLSAGGSASRMARLAQLLNQTGYYSLAVKHLMDCCEAGLAADGIGNVLNPFDTLTDIGENLTEEQEFKLRGILKRGLSEAQANGNPFDTTSYLQAIADLEKLQGAFEESDSALEKVAKSLENRASVDENPSPLIQLSWLEQALDVYARLGDSKAQARVRRKIQDFGPSMRDILHKNSTPFEIPQETIKELEEKILSIGDLDKAIRTVTISLPALPDYEELKRVANRLRAEHPIQNLFSTVVVNDRGPIAYVDDANREKYDAFQQMSLAWNLKLIMRIEPTFRALSTMGLDLPRAMAIFEEEGVLLSKLTLSYIKIGFKEYFAEHHQAACVFLLLAIEGALRDLVTTASGQPTISYRQGQFSSIGLGPLLDLIVENPVLKEAIGNNVVDFIIWFVGDSLGANIRNAVAHTLIDAENLEKPLASFLVWLHWKFSSYRVVPND